MRTLNQRLLRTFVHILCCRRIPVITGVAPHFIGGAGQYVGGVSHYLSTTEKVLSSGTICLGFWGPEGGPCAIQVFTLRAARPSPPALCHEPATVSLLHQPVNSQYQVSGTGGAVCACPQVPTGPVLAIPS